MVEENTKYIAEAWIEDGKEEDFKKSFLQNFIDQLQHHKIDGEGAGFDADTVDGMHYCQIINAFDDKIKDFMTEFSIGKVLFNKNQSNYFIGFDGVKLYIEDIDGYENYQTLPWVDDDPITPVPDLKEVFISLYNEVIEIQNELQPRFQRLVNGGRMDKKEYIRLKTFAHVGYKPMIPVEYTDFLPCLHSERINHPDLSFVYSLVMPRSGKQNDEYNMYAAIEIAGFKTRADADKYKELQDAAYRYFDLSEPEKINEIAIARMKKICTSIKLSATCLKRKVL